MVAFAFRYLISAGTFLSEEIFVPLSRHNTWAEDNVRISLSGTRHHSGIVRPECQVELDKTATLMKMPGIKHKLRHPRILEESNSG